MTAEGVLRGGDLKGQRSANSFEIGIVRRFIAGLLAIAALIYVLLHRGRER
jgi:hypothetical protein